MRVISWIMMKKRKSWELCFVCCHKLIEIYEYKWHAMHEKWPKFHTYIISVNVPQCSINFIAKVYSSIFRVTTVGKGKNYSFGSIRHTVETDMCQWRFVWRFHFSWCNSPADLLQNFRHDEGPTTITRCNSTASKFSAATFWS